MKIWTADYQGSEIRIELPEYHQITPQHVRDALTAIGMPSPTSVFVGSLDIIVTYINDKDFATLCFSLPSF